MDLSEQYLIEDEIWVWDVMKNLFQAKHINDSMFIKDLETCRQWRHYNVILENSGIILISR
jgi:hypothetical protein